MRCRVALQPRARRVSMVLMDVDGVLTDGGIWYSDSEREAKRYDVKDGVALWMARRLGLRTGLISGRAGTGALRRARELKMDEIHFRARDKLATYQGILRRRRLSDAQICYIGDDLIDLPILMRAGLPVAVADAHPDVLRRARFVTRAPGGHGAIREVVDAILSAQGHRDTILGWFDAVPNAGRRNGAGRPPR